MVITITHEGKTYCVEDAAYNSGKIVLPDGTVLQVNAWHETMPPKPHENSITVIKKLFSGKTPDEIAEFIGGSVAEELRNATYNKISIEYNGKTYLVAMTAYTHKKKIVLPDKTVLMVEGWFESSPPQPMELIEVRYQIDETETLEGVAHRVNGVVAESY